MSEPLYGGTETLIDKTMPAFGIGAVRVADAINRDAVMAGAKAALDKAKAKGGKVGLLVTETPANPTNSLVDLRAVARGLGLDAGSSRATRPPVAVDNTFLGPVFQKPLEHGARSRDVFADEVRRRPFRPRRRRRRGTEGAMVRRCGSCAVVWARSSIRTRRG